MNKLTSFILALTSLVLLSSCGGSSGGGDDFFGAGRTAIQVTPNRIDVGDRMRVRVWLEDAIEDGVALKIRFPDALDYVPDTGALITHRDDRTVPRDPDVDVKINGVNYLVWYITVNQLDENRDGLIEFQLVGRDRVREGKVAVDADVIDPLVDIEDQFDPEDPEFQVEASDWIEVID